MVASPARMVRRHTSSFTLKKDVESSLTRRAAGKRGAARSGPHAPKNRCCPAKSQPQKKVVPRSQAKRRPPPASKPRRPTQQPKPRRPDPSKQAVKRPAVRYRGLEQTLVSKLIGIGSQSRARRQPGVQQKPKPTTPKRKPTRRPRGKPRQRRRKR